MTDFTIDMQKSVPAGVTVFKVTNRGKDKSSFEITGNGLDKNLDGISSGETKTVQVDLKPGIYTIRHTETDRTAQLTVTQHQESMPPVNGTGRETTTPPRDSTSGIYGGTMTGQDSASNVPGAPTALEINLTESDIMMPSSVPAGQKSLRITNSSKEVQTFKIMGTGLEKPVEIARLNGGESRTLQVNLQPGTYKVVFGITRELRVIP